MKSEFEFINWLRAQTASAPEIIAGIGDDAAVISPNADRELLITTDLLIEDIHFKFDYTSPSLLGYKALAVNLSDIAAMGGRPRYFLLSLARPREIDDGTLEAITSGMLSLARERGVSLIGGDTCAARQKLFISITVIGDCSQGKAIRRNTAKAGDLIYVSGSLGGAALGLEMLRKGKRLKDARSEVADTGALRVYLADTAALRAHLMPEPRIAIGAAIGEQQLATAMIDISDGLSNDLGHICDESGVGAEIDAAAIPIMTGATLEQALNGGEDYELLFTVAREKEAEVEQLRTQFSATDITKIGAITSDRNCYLMSDGKKEPLKRGGYDHFTSDRWK